MKQMIVDRVSQKWKEYGRQVMIKNELKFCKSKNFRQCDYANPKISRYAMSLCHIPQFNVG